MSPKDLLVTFLLLQVLARTSTVGFVSGPAKQEQAHDLLRAMVNLVKACHGSDVKTVGIAGEWPDSLMASLMSEKELSAVLLDGTTNWSDRSPRSRISRSKLQTFVVEARSRSQLSGTLGSVRSSRWWNHMASFYIVDWSADGNNCAKALECLWEAWSTNILRATFVCVLETRGIVLYTFNPYISGAPHPWRLVGSYSGENNHPWSLFVQEYSTDTCRTMDFDRTKDLGGYEILASVQKSPSIRVVVNRSGIDALENDEGDFFAYMFDSLNARVKLLVHESNENTGYVDDDGVAHGVLAETYYGRSDIQLREKNLLRLPDLTWTYPHYYTGQSVLTQYSGRETQLKKIIGLFDAATQVGLVIFCLLTPVFLKLFLTRTPAEAALDTLRLICNSCLPKLPFQTSSRIYLSGVFLFVVTIQGTYQGGLSSLLAKRVPLSNIDTMQDLAGSHHKIYGRRHNQGFFSSEEFKGRFIGIADNCTGYVLKDSSAACIKSRNHLLADAAHSKLHLSKYYVLQFPLVWVIRDDWPLEGKINMVIQSLVETDIFRLSYEKPHEKLLRSIRANDNEDRDRSFKILNLEDLEFAFVILEIGLIGSGVMFIGEVLIGRAVFLGILKSFRETPR